MEFLRNGENATAAYKAAKPHVTTETASVEGSRLLGNPSFIKVLQQERERFNEIINMSRDEWIKELVELARSKPEKVETAGKLKALEILGKAQGYLSDRLDLTSGNQSITESWVSAIRKLREDDTIPKLTSEDVDKILAAEIVD